MEMQGREKLKFWEGMNSKGKIGNIKNNMDFHIRVIPCQINTS
jgi:hypothetical protein